MVGKEGQLDTLSIKVINDTISDDPYIPLLDKMIARQRRFYKLGTDPQQRHLHKCFLASTIHASRIPPEIWSSIDSR